MISQEIIEEIRQKADIVNVISSYINVIKKGNSFVAVCPFHSDKNPSLQISRSKQIFKCFSCGAGGNVFTFVQDFEKISFLDAVKKVASLVGYANQELEKSTRNISNENKETLEALKSANDLYSFTLKTQEGKIANDYLEKRNISLDMADYFSLGYSPDEDELSIKLLRAKGISIEALDKAGILSRSNSKFLDRFQGRLIFPLFNEHSEVIGFSARRLVDNDEAKYVNSPNTDLFNKSRILYNYQNALKEAKKENCVYVVEGFMDVFSLYKAGIKSSVAIMGTAFTPYHAKMLRRLNVEVRLCLDGDDAGQNAMLKMIEILDKEQLNYRVVNYKDCKLDPDEILQTYGVDNLKKFLNRLFSRDEFVFQYFKKRNDLNTSDGRKNFASSLIPYVTSLQDQIAKDVLITKICEATGISKEVYIPLVGGISKSPNVDNKEGTYKPIIPHKKVNRLYKVSNQIIYQMLNCRDAINDFISEGNNYFIDDLYDSIANYIIDCYHTNKNFEISDFITIVSQEDNEKSKNIINKVTSLLEFEKKVDYSKQLMCEYFEILHEVQKKQIEDEKMRKTFAEAVLEDQVNAWVKHNKEK